VEGYSVSVNDLCKRVHKLERERGKVDGSAKAMQDFRCSCFPSSKTTPNPGAGAWRQSLPA